MCQALVSLRPSYFVLRFYFVLLILDRLLGAIDDQHLDRSALRIQLEPELLLHRGEQRRAVRIDGDAVELQRLIGGAPGGRCGI